MDIQLIDTSKEMCNEWAKLFIEHKGVSIHNCSLFDVETDCVVSPANSFGFMDGNLDCVISEYVGWDVQEKLQKYIKENHNGELLVGDCEVLETSHEMVKYVISAPTMRVPSIIKNTVNVYLASKAIFRALKKLKRVDTVTISGLGTGCGEVSFDICARQMHEAYKHTILGDSVDISDWRKAQEYDYYLRGY